MTAMGWGLPVEYHKPRFGHIPLEMLLNLQKGDVT